MAACTRSASIWTARISSMACLSALPKSAFRPLTRPRPPGLKGSTDPRVKGSPPPPAGAWFALPSKFADPSTSGLTVQVGSGPADIDLK